MVSLERIFDLDLPQDKCKETTLQGQGIIPLNLGMPEHPQEVYLGSSCTLGEWENLRKLLSRYKDVIA